MEDHHWSSSSTLSYTSYRKDRRGACRCSHGYYLQPHKSYCLSRGQKCCVVYFRPPGRKVPWLRCWRQYIEKFWTRRVYRQCPGTERITRCHGGPRPTAAPPQQHVIRRPACSLITYVLPSRYHQQPRKDREEGRLRNEPFCPPRA